MISTELNMSSTKIISEDYFCGWSVPLDIDRQYLVSVVRNSIAGEELSLVAANSQSRSQSTFWDDDLTPVSGNIKQYYTIRDADSVSIFARNLYATDVSTFKVEVELQPTEYQKATVVSGEVAISGMLFLVGMCLIVLLVCFLIVMTCTLSCKCCQQHCCRRCRYYEMDEQDEIQQRRMTRQEQSRIAFQQRKLVHE